MLQEKRRSLSRLRLIKSKLHCLNYDTRIRPLLINQPPRVRDIEVSVWLGW
jgi:hypothetical protein